MGSRARLYIFGCIGLLACTFFCTAAEPPWMEVRSPNFTVISDASVKQARRVAKTLEQFRVLLQTVLALKVDPGSPLIVFAARDGEGLKALLPGDRKEKGALQPTGMFLAGPEKNFVILRTDIPDEQRYHIIYHEYVHMVMRLNFQSLPLWLAEGLAELFAHANISDKESSFGDASPEFLQVLRKLSIIPLSTLIAVTPDSPYYRQTDMARIFYAQSWALTHYLMLGDKGIHASQLREFLGLLQSGVSEQEATERALGDLKTLQQNLARYVGKGRYYHYKVPVRLHVNEGQYPARALSQAESLAMRGELLIHTDRLNEAKKMLEQALRLEPRSARANAGMGLIFMRLQDQGQAQEYLSKAIGLDSKSFLVQFYAAQLAYQKDGDYGAAETHLRKALAINPQFAPACGALSYILTMQGKKLPEALELAVKAANLQPADLSHRILVGQILMKTGKYDEATRIGERVLALAHTEAERREAESLLFMIKGRQERSLEAQKRAAALPKELTRIEDLRPAGAESETRRQAEATTGEQSPETTAPKIKSGAAGKVEGVIRSVRCEFPAIMDVVLDSNGKQYRLRSQNYREIQYWAGAASGNDGFRPCEQLEGKLVEIEFLSVSGQEYSGIIRSVTWKR
jgi:tetratricopeptide (TPR) repeat protein